jgi:hypothetical protein
VTIDGVWIGNRIHCTLRKLVTTLYGLLSQTGCVLNHSLQCSVWQRLPTRGFLLFPGSRLRRLAAISHQPPTLPTAISRLFHTGSWSSLYSLGTDRFQQFFYCWVTSLSPRTAQITPFPFCVYNRCYADELFTVP